MDFKDPDIFVDIEYNPEKYGHCLAYSPDGTMLAIGMEDNKVEILHTEKLEILHKLSHDYSVHTVEWSPDGKFLATGGINGSIQIWDTLEWRVVKLLPNSKGAMNLSWSSNSKYLAVGTFYCSGEKAVDIWTTSDWTKIPTKNDYAPRDVSFSPNNSYLALNYFTLGVEILSVSSFTRSTFLDFSGSEMAVNISSPVWSIDSSFLAACSDDGRVRVWETADWATLFTKKINGSWDEGMYRAAFSPDNRFLVTGGVGTPKLLSTIDWQIVFDFKESFSEDILDFSWHPSSKFLAIVSSMKNPVLIWKIP